MKKTITLLLALFSATLLLAKPYTQHGIAYLYDYKTKTKKPVANVRLTISGAQPTVSRADGTFALVFDSYGLGEKISFDKQPYYQGMKVFNKKEVDNWFIVKDRLRLIMCRYEEFELAKNNYYQQGLRAATAKYEKEISRIKADHKLKETEKNQKLQDAEEHLQQVMESLNETSEAMARIDQSEVDVQMQEVLDLYEKGEVDEAMKRLSNMRLEKSLEQSLKDKAVHQAGLQTAIEDSARAVQNIRSAIELYKNNYEWGQVIKYQKILADKLGTPFDLFEYAYYCSQVGGDPNEIELYYEKVLDAIKKSKQGDTFHLYLYATTMNNLALIYEAKGLNKKAEQALKEGIEGRRKYACLTRNPADENHSAWSLVSYGDMLVNRGEFEKGKKCLDEAEEIYSRIKSIYFENNEWVYGRLYDKLAWYYVKTNKITEAENYYKLSLELYRKCVSQNPYDHLRSMIQISNWGLFPLYESQERYKDEEKYINDLIILVRSYSCSDSKVMLVFTNLLFEISKKYKERGRINDWIFIRKEWFECSLNNIVANRSRIKDVEMNDVILELEVQKRYGECADICKKYLDFYREMNNGNWDYQKKIVGELCNLSYYVLFQQEFMLAEQYAHESIEMDSNYHLPQTNLAAALLLQGRYSEAEPIYRRYKDEMKDSFLDDFEQFKAAGVIPKEREEDVEKIKRMLEE